MADAATETDRVGSVKAIAGDAKVLADHPAATETDRVGSVKDPRLARWADEGLVAATETDRVGSVKGQHDADVVFVDSLPQRRPTALGR